MENSSNKFITFFSRFLTWQLLIAVAIGAVAGYAYYYFIGCNSGTCPITSNPINTIFYGAMMGAILGFKDKTKTKNVEIESKNEQNLE